MSFRNPRLSCLSLRNRRLLFESLERRDLLTVMRVVDWNTMNGPNDATADANYSTVLQAIGNETVQGNTERIDILALQETDGPGPGGDSIDQIKNVLNSLYPTTTYAAVYTPVDGGGDATGFVYDTSSVTLLNSIQIGGGTLTHNILRGEFQPVGGSNSSIFYVYSTHLKSGDDGASATQRGTEAAFLRADADSLGAGTQVLFVGDFNMKGSDETAYQNLVAPGAAQLQDVADAPGHWNANPAFITLHSQDPQTNMDDRFDIQFGSAAMFDGVGVDYVPNSFHVFGNNGTHTLGQPITTGTGASPAVLNALVADSDHLPAVGDYEIVSTPNVRISQTLGATKVVEGGLYDTYQVVLDTVPTSNVTVTVSPDSQLNVGNGGGVARQLTFTPANALTPQTVVVHAVDDALAEGDHTGLITHSVASSDPAYSGLTISSVTVSIIDNDAPAIVINEIDSDQTSTDAGEFVELYDGGVGNVSLSGKTLVFFNGSDDKSYKTFDLTGKFTNASGFFVLGNSGVTPMPDIVFSNNTLQNGPDAVALYAASASSFPNGTTVTTANLLDAVVYGSTAADATLLSLLQPGQPQVDENQNGLVTTQSLARIPDGGTQRQTSTYVAQTPTPDTFNAPQTYGVQILQSAGRVDVQEGGATDSYQLALLSIPTANVQITVDPDSQVDLGAGPGVPIVLTFTPANALIPQTVTITAVDDNVVEGNHTSTITHTVSSGDSHYNGLAVSNVVANIVDNDFPPPTSIVIDELMYDPASDETAPGVGEWIEVVNTGTAATDLSNWLFDDEDATNWTAVPSGTVLNPNQVAVFFDSAFTTEAIFRSEWNVPANALVVGIGWGNLSDNPSGPGDEVLTLYNNVGQSMDVVKYDNSSPWPTDSKGHSIYLKDLVADNNSGANWARSLAGSPTVVSPSGPTFSVSDIGSPGRVFLAGDYNGSGAVDSGDYVLWRKTLGSAGQLSADQSGSTVGVPNGVVDQADYTYWRSNFGATFTSNGAGSGSGLGDLPSVTTAASTGTPAAPPISQPMDVNMPMLRAGQSASVDNSAVQPASAAGSETAKPAAVESLPGSLDLLLLTSGSAPTIADDVSMDAAASAAESRSHDATDQMFASLSSAEFFGGLVPL